MRSQFIRLAVFLALAACQTTAKEAAPDLSSTGVAPAERQAHGPVPGDGPDPMQPAGQNLATEPAAPASQTPLPPSATPAPLRSATPPASPSPIPQISIVFTGQIVPGRCVQAGVEARGNADYIYAAVRELLGGADLTVGTVNGTISETAPKTGCVQTFVLTGDPIHADAMARAGFDLVSAATNHIKNCGPANCGDQAFFETLANLHRAGIRTVGAGADHDQAMQPIMIEVSGVRFVFVSLGHIEPRAFAGPDTPGIAVLNEENLRQAIGEAGQLGDVVILLPHWGPEYVPNPNYLQTDLARIAVQAGADLIIGNHTHVVQAITEIDGVPVFYGLGNFVFDQTWSAETTQSIIVRATFLGQQLSGYEIIPVVSDRDGALRLATPQESAEIMARIEAASQALR